MICQNCQNNDTAVIDSRDDGKSIWRRRKCVSCGNRFTTYERQEVPRLTIIKRDKRRELFSKDKIIAGVQKACEKRPVAIADICALADKVEKKLFELGEPEIQSKIIGEMVIQELEKLDKVAYIRFASIYRDFKTVKSFDKELKKIMKK